MKLVPYATLLLLLPLAACLSQHDPHDLTGQVAKTTDEQRAKRNHHEMVTRVRPLLRQGQTEALQKLARRLVRDDAGQRAATWLLDFMQRGRDREKVAELRAAVALYLMLPDAKPERVFAALISAKRLDVRRTAWQVATQHPSPEIAQAVEQELVRRGQDGLSPEAALAARANGIKA